VDSIGSRNPLLSGAAVSQVIHILGGGIAGISAAVRLAEFGFFPVIIEKNKHLGGRAYSFTDKETGDEIDNGQHLLMSNYQHTQWLLEKLKTGVQIEYQTELTIPYLIRNRMGGVEKKTLKAPAYPFPFHLVGLLLKSDLFTRKEKIALVDCLPLKWKDPARYRSLIVKELLHLFNQPESLIDKFWIPFVESALNTSIQNSSASLLIKTLQKSILKGGKYCRMGFPLTGLSHIFADPAEKYFRKFNVKIEKNMVISKIRFNDRGEVNMLEDDKGREIPVSYLIAAVPFMHLKKLLPLQVFDKFWNPENLQYEYSPIVSIYLWTKKPLFHDPFFCLQGSKLQWIFNKRVFGGPYKSNYFIYQITISAGDLLGNEPVMYIEKVVKEELPKFFPKFEMDQLHKIRVIKEKKATPLSNIPNEKNRDIKIDLSTNMILAGDWVQTQLPYTIEGAAQSGIEAADHLINALFWG